MRVRFVSAIVAFVVAAAMIVFGIAQRTWLAPPDRLSASVSTAEEETAFTVIPGSVLAENPGQQQVRISGGDTVWAAYARTSDIVAWLGDEPYTSLRYDAETDKLSARLVEPDPADEEPAEGEATEGQAPATETPAAPATPEAAPSPAGSDLWLEERQEEGSLSWTMNVPDDVSLLVASDGTAPAPSRITVSWPLTHATPWAGPLIIGGGVLLLVGLGLYIWGLVHMRRTRGPRRKSPPKQPKLPAAPRPRAIRAPVLEPETTAKGRRAARRTAIVSGGVAAALLLSGCTAVNDLFESDPAPVPTATASDAPAEEVQPVAVTEGQLRRIVERISETVTQADTEKNADLAATRLAGLALLERKANYLIRNADAGVAAPAPIPATPVTLDLPQATDTWPRTVLAVVGGEDPAVAPVALVLVQETPRDNYLVNYEATLQSGVPFPAVAPPSVGAPLLPNDIKLLKLQPDLVATQYADILSLGDASQYAANFEAEPDGLRTQVGVDYKNAKKASFPTTASLEFTSALGPGPVLTLASNDSGGIVATSILENEIAKPVEDGATVNLEGQVKALSGLTSTAKGVESTYCYQLLFYIPPSTEEGKVILLGYSQSLIGVREL